MEFTDEEIVDLAQALEAAGREGSGASQAIIDKIADEAERRGLNELQQAHGYGSITVRGWRGMGHNAGYPD